MAFQMMFVIITPALITGALAGRLKFRAWIAICLTWSLIVYPVIAHWVFDPAGWIYRLGGRDFAGGAVVQLSAGGAAAVLVLLLRPRTAPDYSPRRLPSWCSARASCGSAGSVSTPAPPSARTGLATITPAAGYVGPLSATAIGAVGAAAVVVLRAPAGSRRGRRGHPVL
jgi:ammonia channel protein AmtB